MKRQTWKKKKRKEQTANLLFDLGKVENAKGWDSRDDIEAVVWLTSDHVVAEGNHFEFFEGGEG